MKKAIQRVGLTLLLMVVFFAFSYGIKLLITKHTILFACLIIFAVIFALFYHMAKEIMK